MSSCLFCDVADGRAGMAPENVVIAANDLAFAKPALGQFVDGYTLVVSRDHVRSFSEMSAADLADVEELKNRIAAELRRLYHQRIVVFEHGCGDKPESRGGSCIDHAHLHVLPLPVSLECDLQRRFRSTSVTKLADLALRREAPGPYLYLEDGSGERFTFELDTPIPSQFLRRLICQRLNQPTLWDWRTHPFRDRIASFTAMFGQSSLAALPASRY